MFLTRSALSDTLACRIALGAGLLVVMPSALGSQHLQSMVLRIAHVVALERAIALASSAVGEDLGALEPITLKALLPARGFSAVRLRRRCALERRRVPREWFVTDKGEIPCF